ncbi:Cellulose synthase 1 [Thalassovita gelatinovora]|uniref:Cellulose synthase 1 n=1 Tax=Thalassovita gelatinovora TaxID=53501 RepID=A0A0P1FI90_THAGE|nr:glycosyltransferase [Thalassovita gelatinovora]QIZ82040.1 glycosyltransferase [Thalassovita gelatinovora]CUH67529.1 Cellulose synthase 1 [Thalassovita gelatinovora]SEP72337.1 cellulose synthase (UDP-forming) [Thalassovita gelatinovora]
MTGRRHPALEPRPNLEPLLTGGRALKYFVIAGMWFLAAGWFWAWWLQPQNMIAPLRYWIVTVAMLWIWGMQLYFVLVFLSARKSVAPDPQPGQYRVAMITTKTPAEPFEVVRETLQAMLAQDYPHDTWLADENPDTQTKHWCIAHGVKISTRYGIAEYHRAEWPRRTRCKEGNLAYFYDHWGYRDYDIVSQLDADHLPQPGYLREMLRPFSDDAVGYVSAPSICAANADTSWAARTRLYSEAAFHGVFQAGYTAVLTPMCIGSHYAVRTKALKGAGGLGPELAEDHSTTMLISSAGWRGVHAIDAIAVGQGPDTLADLVTQEFQWSRSLLSLLLRYTPRYLKPMPMRLKLLFLLCQTWYVFFALSMSMMYLVPIIAVSFDIRFADVTYPAFLGHSLPAVGVMILFAYAMKRDGFFRPRRAKVLAWEKALFVMLQWPWVLWGCVMAVRDRITGKFVDFRITPKGAQAENLLPGKIIAVYAALALGALIPVLLVTDVTEARGFYLLSLVNAVLYCILLSVALVAQLKRAGRNKPLKRKILRRDFSALSLIMVLLGGAVTLRGQESLHALAVGLQPMKVVKVEYIVSGAGMGNAEHSVRLTYLPGWAEALVNYGK